MNHRQEAEAALRNLHRSESANDIIASALTSIAHSLLAAQDGAIESTAAQMETQRKILAYLQDPEDTDETGQDG